MTHEATSIFGNVDRRARRRRRWLIALAVLALLIVIQSITITLPIRGRVVDEASGEPVRNAAVAALWQLEAWTPLQKVPGGALRTDEVLTDEHGAFDLPMTLMVHVPLAPFSPLARTDADMPMLIVVADGYHPKSAENDVYGIDGPKHASGFLSVRTSSLQGAVLRLIPLPQAPSAQQRSEYQGNLGWARTEISLAAGSCASRWYCKSHSLAQVRSAIERGAARARSSRATAPTEEQL